MARMQKNERKRMKRIILQPSLLKSLFCMLAAAMLLVACGQDSPEQQVRMFVKAGEEAVEGRDAGDLKELISEQYNDQQQRTRRDITLLAARYFFMNKKIHILTRIDGLLFPSPDKAQLSVYAAMTGQNVSDLDSLLNMQADLYRFDIELIREEEEWKLSKAGWRPARGEDFF